MRRIDDRFETRDGVSLARTVWDPAGRRAVEAHGDGGLRPGVLLIHGMAEHRTRYAELGEALAARGFVVWAYDQRGHGDTAAGPESRRHIAPGDDWMALVEDARELLSALARALAAADAAGTEAAAIEAAGTEARGTGITAEAEPRPEPAARFSR